MWKNYVISQAQLRVVWAYGEMSAVGPADLILWDGVSEPLPCDVKAKTQRGKALGSNNYHQIHLQIIPENVYMIQVDPSDKTISWHKDRIPFGWENFWKSTYEIIN